jgi:cell division protein FtsI (penicillin-binding protein 3)
VTPLHLIRAMLAVNGGGTFRELTLLKDKQHNGAQVISERTSQLVNRMMRGVVRHGTAKFANVEGYAVGAKTGTANKVVGGRYDNDKKRSSLIAAFPMPKPEYLIFVMLDEPEGTKDTFNYATAGWVAAPVAARVVSEMAHLLGMPPHHRMHGGEIDRMIVEAAQRHEKGRRQHDYVRQATY